MFPPRIDAQWRTVEVVSCFYDATITCTLQTRSKITNNIGIFHQFAILVIPIYARNTYRCIRKHDRLHQTNCADMSVLFRSFSDLVQSPSPPSVFFLFGTPVKKCVPFFGNLSMITFTLAALFSQRHRVDMQSDVCPSRSSCFCVIGIPNSIVPFRYIVFPAMSWPSPGSSLHWLIMMQFASCHDGFVSMLS